jgi:hypothetical protein
MRLDPLGVSLVITLQPEDVETLQLIQERHSRDDHTGIIAHILSQYEMKVDSGLNTKVQA